MEFWFKKRYNHSYTSLRGSKQFQESKIYYKSVTRLRRRLM